MAKFDSKSFNPQAFGSYVKKIPNVTKNELAKSGAVGANEQAAAALSNQTGSLYARVPYFGRISGGTSQNNDGGTDITSTGTTTYEQGFIAASRMDSWTEKSFSKNITAGVDFMDNVASQIGDYKMEVKQAMLLAILKGIYAMKTTGTLVHEKSAKEFVEKHTFDIAYEAVGENAGLVKADSLNKAIQRACGDNKNIFKLVIMHSEVSTNLENLKLLKYMTYTDAEGVTRDLAIGSWNGKTVLIDDNMPTAAIAACYGKSTAATPGALKVVANTATPGVGEIKLESVTPAATGYTPAVGDFVLYIEAGTAYTSYVLGEDAIILDDIGDSVPYEMSRDAKTNGGQDTLYVRDRFVCGVDGISFEKPSSIIASASNADLETGTNWNVINDGAKAIPHKAIPIARIISRG
ncbi:MAG: phage coat protein [Oscillospiraceae bacterium]